MKLCITQEEKAGTFPNIRMDCQFLRFARTTASHRQMLRNWVLEYDAVGGHDAVWGTKLGEMLKKRCALKQKGCRIFYAMHDLKLDTKSVSTISIRTNAMDQKHKSIDSKNIKHILTRQ